MLKSQKGSVARKNRSNSLPIERMGSKNGHLHLQRQLSTGKWNQRTPHPKLHPRIGASKRGRIQSPVPGIPPNRVCFGRPWGEKVPRHDHLGAHELGHHALQLGQNPHRRALHANAKVPATDSGRPGEPSIIIRLGYKRHCLWTTPVPYKPHKSAC